MDKNLIAKKKAEAQQSQSTDQAGQLRGNKSRQDVDKRLTELIANAVREGLKPYEDRFSRVDDDIYDHEERISSMEEKLEKTIAGMKNLGNRHLWLESDYSTFDKRVEDWRRELDQMVKQRQEELDAFFKKHAERDTAKVDALETVGVKLAPAADFSGFRPLFFIHGEDGKIDWQKPFTSCLLAKRYDPNYAVKLYKCESGKFVREATLEEAARYEW